MAQKRSSQDAIRPSGDVVDLTINGQTARAAAGATIMETAHAHGITIPSLCADPRLHPTGRCGICVTLVKMTTGAAGAELLLACETKVAPGMEVVTESDEIAARRRDILNRLLADHNAYCESPCHYACPAGIDIPGYLAAIARGDDAECVRIIKERLPLPRIIGRICPRPCEASCRRAQVDGEPVAICRLKQFAGDRTAAEGAAVSKTWAKASGKKVAVIGGGPSGLSAAYYLTLAGHAVTIFEANSVAGGMMRTGIPAYRLPKQVIDDEVNDILRLGVNIEYNVRLGADFTVADLKDRGFDSVYLAVGAQRGSTGAIEGAEGQGVYTAVDFLNQVNAGTFAGTLGRTAVIGGGFTAVDAVRSALRLGANEVRLIYRRTRREMPAGEDEVREAEVEGARLIFLTAPLAVGREEGRITGLVCQKMQLGEPDADGRRRPVAVEGSDFTIEVDTIIMAVGQEVESAGFDASLAFNRGGAVKVEGTTLATDMAGVFAGGDCVRGPATVVEAIADGRRAAVAIDAWLNGREPAAAVAAPATGLEHRPPAFFDIGAKPLSDAHRAKMPELEPARRRNFDEVELGFTEEQARTEAARCLQCGCHAASACELQRLAIEYAAGATEFKGKRGEYPPLDALPMFFLDRKRCIKCHNCVRVCNEVQQQRVYTVDADGYPALNRGATYKEAGCEFCGQCLSACPTGSLAELPPAPAKAWEVEKTVTVCPYCGVGCALELHVKDNQIVKVASPYGLGVNDGNLCVKGKFGYHFVASPDRLSKPLIRKGDDFVEASWEEAIALIAGKLNAIKTKHGADSIAGLSSAKCTNEENFVFQKFIRAAVGTNNVDHCARLCHASTVAGLNMAFGSGAMSNSITDLENAKVILVIGSNTTEAHPVIGLSVLKAVSESGAKLIVIDPRAIKLTKFADIWLAQKPGTDAAVLNGLMNVILEEGLADEAFIAERTEGYDELKKTLPDYTPEKVEDISGIPADELRRAARIFAAANDKSGGGGCIVYSMGITQHTTGVDNVLAIANLAMMTGNIGKPGTGVSPLRGQNNVQGSCDMGALPNVFSGYQRVDDQAVRDKFSKAWGVDLPDMPGLTVVEMMNAAADGRLKAMYIMGENPMLSDPDVGHVEKALKKLDFLVVQDIFMTETADFADVVLPALASAERDGTFTNTERRVQRVRQAVQPVGEAKADWRIISDLATAMGYPMSHDSSAEIMAEVARLTPSFGGITHERLENGGLQWPCPAPDHPGTPILHIGQFTRGKGKFHAIEFKPPAEEPDAEYPLILTTGRILNQYHTGTMIRRTDGIDEIYPVAAAEISPKDAKKLGIADGDKVRLITRRGQIEATALVTDKSRPGVVFMPFHFKEAPANKLTNPALDPIAKIPEYKVCALRLEKAR